MSKSYSAELIIINKNPRLGYGSRARAGKLINYAKSIVYSFVNLLDQVKSSHTKTPFVIVHFPV